MTLAAGEPSAASAPLPHLHLGAGRRAALVAIGAVVLLVALALVSPLDAADRSAITNLTLLLGGVAFVLTAGTAARRDRGLRRLGWSLMALAAATAVVGNTVTAMSPAGSVLGNLLIAAALLLVGAGAVCLPRNRWRGRVLATLLLDGVLVVAAVLVIASSLVYSDLLAAAPSDPLNQTAALLIPVIDVVLATIATVLFLRSRGTDRTVMAMIAAGSVLYVLSDLNYAAGVARGDFGFGSWTDLGWIGGYALLLASPLVATSRVDPVAPRSPGADVAGTGAIFGLLMLAGVVQIMTPVRDDVRNAQALLWLTLIAAAAVRQIILSRENHGLRLGLERRVEAQTADLRRLARRTAVVVESVGDGIYSVDEQGRVTLMNTQGRSLLGLEDGRLTGVVAHDAFHAPRNDGTTFPRSGCYISDAIENGALAVGEEDEYVRGDGTRLPVEITASPITDEVTGETTGAVVVFRDATARREMERIKQEFLSVVSHELRTPLTSIRGSLGLLTGGVLGELPPQAARVAKVAEDSSERLARLINDMLDLERLATGTVVLEIAPVPASEVLDGVVRELAGLARVHDIVLEVEHAEGTALADRDRIVQVMTNLVGNAVKFSSPGQRVRLAAREADGELRVMVRDQGRGIPAAELERIFERFHQVDSSDSRLKGGSGLGLAISRDLIERMGGRIWADSVEGSETTFWFTLPLAALQHAP